ncbi:MAG TPA: hypothetical protein VGQ11_07975 [Candidatus Acidoferrales bacterium]|nr:hypothetical protein [Candidatus Acidoferrales bacterium]
MVGLSVLLWVLLRAKGWGAAAGWTALALAGQACSLQLLEAGPRVRPQMFYPWGEILHTTRHVFFFVLILQAVLVAWGTWRHLRPGIATLRRVVSLPALLLGLAVMVFASTTLAPEVAQTFVHGGFAAKMVVQSSKIALSMLMLLVGLGNLALAATTLPQEALESLAWRWRKRNTRALPWLAALWVVVVSYALAVVVLERMPHVPDEATYLFHAKYFAAGELYLPMPPDAEALHVDFTIADGTKWYSVVAAGWPAVLAIGVWLGAPWLVGPLLGGLTVLLAHALFRRLYDREIADASALLMAASPWLLYLSASLMTHGLTAVLALLGLLGVESARERGSAAGGVLAGLSFGALLHARPLEAVIVAGVAGIWWLAAGWKKLRIAALGSTAVIGAAMTTLLLAYNKMLTGSINKIPQNVWTDLAYYPGSNRIGFGKDIGNFGWTGLDALPGHGPIDVVMNTNHNLYMLNFEIFGWACGSILFALLLVLLRRSQRDGLLWGLVAATWAGLSCYWFSGGPDFGARYWYQMFVPLVALTALGAREFAAALDANAAGANAGSGRRVWAFVLLAGVIGMANLLAWRAVDKYRNYRGVRSDVRALLRENDFGKSLVLVRGTSFPDYTAATPFNPATFDRDYPGPIFAFDANPESTKRIKDYFSDRPVWVLAGPSVTGAGFRIVERPAGK